MSTVAKWATSFGTRQLHPIFNIQSFSTPGFLHDADDGGGAHVDGNARYSRHVIENDEFAFKPTVTMTASKRYMLHLMVFKAHGSGADVTMRVFNNEGSGLGWGWGYNIATASNEIAFQLRAKIGVSWIGPNAGVFTYDQTTFYILGLEIDNTDSKGKLWVCDLSAGSPTFISTAWTAENSGPYTYDDLGFKARYEQIGGKGSGAPPYDLANMSTYESDAAWNTAAMDALIDERHVVPFVPNADIAGYEDWTAVPNLNSGNKYPNVNEERRSLEMNVDMLLPSADRSTTGWTVTGPNAYDDLDEEFGEQSRSVRTNNSTADPTLDIDVDIVGSPPGSGTVCATVWMYVTGVTWLNDVEVSLWEIVGGGNPDEQRGTTLTVDEADLLIGFDQSIPFHVTEAISAFTALGTNQLYVRVKAVGTTHGTEDLHVVRIQVSVSGGIGVAGDYIESSTNGHKQQFTFQDLNGAEVPKLIMAHVVGQAVSALDFIACTTGVDLETAGEDTQGQDTVSQTDWWDSASKIYETAPGGAAWSNANFDAFKCGLKKTTGGTTRIKSVVLELLGEVTRPAKVTAGDTADVAACSVGGGAVVELDGVIAGVSTLAGVVVLDMVLAGQIAGVSSVSGGIQMELVLSGQIDAVSGLSALLSLDLPLSGTIAGQSAVSGDIGLDLPLAGVVAGQSGVSGDIGLTLPLAGSIDGVSTLSGDIVRVLALAGEIAGQSAVSGDILLDMVLTGIISGQSTVDGDIALDLPLTGVVGGQSGVAGDLALSLTLSGSIDGVSTISGDIVRTLVLAGVISGQSEISGVLEILEAGSALTLHRIRARLLNAIIMRGKRL